MVSSFSLRAQDGHTPSHLLILSTSFFLFPFSLLLAIVSFILSRIQTLRVSFPQRPPNRILKSRVLITSNDEITTLAFARLANDGGHDVFVVNRDRYPAINPIQRSRAIKRAVSVLSAGQPTRAAVLLARVLRKQIACPPSLPETILRLIQNENIELWIPCESLEDSRTFAQAKEVVRRQRACLVFGPTSDMVKLNSDYSAFSHYVAKLDSSIQCPAATIVTSRSSIHNILGNAAAGQKFLMDRNANRRDSHDSLFSSSGYSGTTLDGVDESTIVHQEYRTLPQSSLNETYASVASMTISRDQSWTMHEIHTGRKVLVSCLVFKNTVRAFIARSSTEEYATSSVGETLTNGSHGRMDHFSPTSPTGISLLEFARKFASSLPENTSTHLNLHFVLSETATKAGVLQKLYATGCDFRPSPLLAQLTRRFLTPSTDRTDFFLSKGKPESVILSGINMGGKQSELYSLPKSLIELVATPTWNFLRQRGSSLDIVRGCTTFVEQVVYGQEELFDLRDPLPWVWSWFVETPLKGVSRVARTGPRYEISN